MNSELISAVYRKPAEIAHLVDMPLYLAVAYWSLSLKRAVTVAEVARAFYISESQARDALHYITNDACDVIKSETRMSISKRVHHKTVCVLSVQSGVFNRQKKAPVMSLAEKNTDSYHLPELLRRAGQNNDERIKQLRKWFVSRRKGEKIPDMYLVPLFPL
ncbi:hypothetical protein ABVX93_003746 [Escherichia coli]|nr:hypothetical protein [Shigella flexneri]